MFGAKVHLPGPPVQTIFKVPYYIGPPPWGTSELYSHATLKPDPNPQALIHASNFGGHGGQKLLSHINSGKTSDVTPYESIRGTMGDWGDLLPSRIMFKHFLSADLVLTNGKIIPSTPMRK